jgi:Flp pilus assembly protein TadG
MSRRAKPGQPFDQVARASSMVPAPRSPFARGRSRRGGAVTFELIVTLPILVIFLAAVIEFGLILANTKQVALASRLGAKIAAESGAPFNSGTLAAIRTAVDRQLEAAGFGAAASAGVTLQHNVAGGGSSPQVSGDCPAPSSPPLPADGSGSVRVTVCVELSKLTPDLLSSFGFSIAGKFVESTTTYPYEL